MALKLIAMVAVFLFFNACVPRAIAYDAITTTEQLFLLFYE
jgi:hypothetical protein